MLTLNHFFLTITVIFMWGFNNVVIKWGLCDLPPLFMTFMRFFIVSIILIPFMKINRKQFYYLCLFSITFGIMHFSFLVLGMKYTDSGTGAILVQLGTPFSMILSKLILKENLKKIQILGIMISLSGIIMLIQSPTIASWKAFLFLLSSASGWALGNIIIKKSPEIPPITMTAWIAFISIPIIGLISFLLESNQFETIYHATWKGWCSIFYSAIGSSIIACSIWYKLVKKYTVNIIIPYSLLTPVASIILGAIVLQDALNFFKVIAAILVILGISISVIDFKKYFKFSIKQFIKRGKHS